MRSNSYTLLFTVSVTVVLGFLLSLAATSLKEKQELNVAVDIKKNILRSLEISDDPENPWSNEEVQTLFAEFITGIVVDGEGRLIEGMSPEQITDELKKSHYPVYLKVVNQIREGYAIPISGKGLWSTLFGYIALEPDGVTVKGIKFYKHGETPGLGGEVEKEWFTNNFVGKRIVDESGGLVSIQVVRGVVDREAQEAFHQVDGISGATMTSKGLNEFLLSDLSKYEPFFKRVRAGEKF